MASRSIRIAIAVTCLAALGAPALAEDAVATRAQVEQLQKQLAAMQKEMDAMQKALKESESRGADPMMPMMHQHMMGMQSHWRTMHDQTCMMAPGSCPASEPKSK